MPKTKTFTLTSAAWVVPTAASACNKAMWREDNAAGTADILIAAPASTDTSLTWPAGSWTPVVAKEYEYPHSLFAVGDSFPIALKSAGASMTIAQWEEP